MFGKIENVKVASKLQKMQVELKAPKNKKNSFGNYTYRNVEGIYEALKPLLEKYKTTVLVEDEMLERDNDKFVVATATLVDCESGETVSARAFAREDIHKGMSAEQMSGSTSSYARKYALSALFLLDDTVDVDSDECKNLEEKATKTAPQTKPSDKGNNDKLTALIESIKLACEQKGGKQNQFLMDLLKKEIDCKFSNIKTVEQAEKLYIAIKGLPIVEVEGEKKDE